MEREINTSEFLGKRTFILGDVNTGKTTLSREILVEFCRQGLSSRIAVIDLAPEIPADVLIARGLQGVGGKLLPPEESDVLYLGASLKPPRLSSGTEEEALGIARENVAKIEGLFQDFGRSGRDILFMNDISLYLQAGTTEVLLNWIRMAKTVVANGYYGERLGAGVLSRREKEQTGRLKQYFDEVIELVILPGSGRGGTG
jgi:hypothetical protein